MLKRIPRHSATPGGADIVSRCYCGKKLLMLQHRIWYIFQESDPSNNVPLEKPFWEKLTEDTGLAFPDMILSFDRRAALPCFNDQDVNLQKDYTCIKTFMRNKLIHLLDKAEIPAYFGIYKNRPNQYEIPDGKILLFSHSFLLLTFLTFS